MAHTIPRALYPAAAVLADIVCQRRAEALRIVQRAALDEVGDWVKLHRSGLAAQARGLERDGAAAGEQVEHARRSAAIRCEYMLPSFSDGCITRPPGAESSKEVRGTVLLGSPV